MISTGSVARLTTLLNGLNHADSDNGMTDGKPTNLAFTAGHDGYTQSIDGVFAGQLLHVRAQTIGKTEDGQPITRYQNDGGGVKVDLTEKNIVGPDPSQEFSSLGFTLEGTVDGHAVKVGDIYGRGWEGTIDGQQFILQDKQGLSGKIGSLGQDQSDLSTEQLHVDHGGFWIQTGMNVKGQLGNAAIDEHETGAATSF